MGFLKAIYTAALYHCAQNDFYSAMAYAIKSYLKYLTDFAALSTTYTLAWGEQKKAELAAVEAMPDFQERDELHETIRVQLYNTSGPCLVEWKKLETHIIRTYPKDEHKAKLEAAGSTYYRKAGQRDWESLSALMRSGSHFITENQTELEAGGMPASFVTGFATVYDAFTVKLGAFIEAEEEVWRLRNEKITANNVLYTDIIAMLKDGQKIFRHDESIRKRFVYSRILKLVRGGEEDGTPAEASLKFKMNGNHINFGARLLGLLKILWGDDSFENFTGDPNQVKFIDKVYAVVKLYSIVITGAIDKITELHISDSNLTYIKIHKSMKDLKELILQNNLLTTKVVDDILVTVNKFNTDGPDRVLNLIGNEPPSAKGLAAKAELEARGWIVLVS